MKRLSSSRFTRLPPVRMFIEDVEAIVSKLDGSMDVHLEYDGFSFDSVAEFRGEVPRPWVDHLAITARSKAPPGGDTTIKIEPNGVWLHSWSDTNDAVGTVADQLRSHVRWYSWRPERGDWWSVLVSLTIMFLGWSVAGVIIAVGGIRPISLVIAGLAFVAVLGQLWSERKPLLGGSRIQLTFGLAHMSFWERNRDQLLASAISSLLAALIGFLLGRLVR